MLVYSPDEDIPSKAKVPRLQAKYQSLRKRSKSGDKDLSPRGQLTKYLQQERDVAKPIDAASERNSHRRSPFTLGHHLPTVGAYSVTW